MYTRRPSQRIHPWRSIFRLAAVSGIARERRTARLAPRAHAVHLGGDALAERLVRADVIEHRDPFVERALLIRQRRRREVLQVEPHVDVHPFVRAVVLRVTRPAAHDLDPERDPPGFGGAFGLIRFRLRHGSTPQG
jgi:hypothetical protein